MDLSDERPSESPLVEAIWRSQSEQAVPFISMADSHYAMVVTKHKGRTFLTVRGPETRATSAHGLADGEFVGIRFKLGVFMPDLPPKKVMDRRDLSLPEASGKSFWLNGSAWELPDYENADLFVERLAREGLLVHDPVVSAILAGEPARMSLRTVQRRFLNATGLTHNTIYQIERARYATSLLKQGVPFLDVAFQAGYFDQSHLIRSLNHFVGLTPSQIADACSPDQMSFLYNTLPFAQTRINSKEGNYEKNSGV